MCRTIYIHTPIGYTKKIDLIKEHYIQCNPTLDVNRQHYITIRILKAYSLIQCSFNFIVLFVFVKEHWTIPRTSIGKVISTNSKKCSKLMTDFRKTWRMMEDRKDWVA